ncbi:MAG: hypothetical protein KatS3mg087_0480 [Patescibacteria group bacterium]|nr:MAG: hypothetical protein KatS3mg087_0480 [Patescibacteria group bacterium]
MDVSVVYSFFPVPSTGDMFLLSYDVYTPKEPIYDDRFRDSLYSVLVKHLIRVSRLSLVDPVIVSLGKRQVAFASDVVCGPAFVVSISYSKDEFEYETGSYRIFDCPLKLERYWSSVIMQDELVRRVTFRPFSWFGLTYIARSGHNATSCGHRKASVRSMFRYFAVPRERPFYK